MSTARIESQGAASSGGQNRVSAARGKSLGSVIEQQYRYKDNEKFGGGIKKEKHVLAIDRKMQWKLAQILEVRYEMPYDDEAEFWDPNDQTQATTMENHDEPMVAVEETKNGVPEGGKPTESPEDAENQAEIVKAKSSVEYYVHYLEEERLMDRWVKENMVQINDELVENLKEDWQRRDEEKKKQQLLFNDEHVGMNEEELRTFMNATRLKTIDFVQLGEQTMEVWYHADYPPEYHGRLIYTCPFCLHFFAKKREFEAHSERCEVRCPPGDEIYRDDSLSMFEFDAKQQKVYTENLCYLAKLFLDHKNIWHEIDAFYFYVLCERRADGYYIVGYFSKEKESLDYNLSCIMVLPAWQSKGYGKFLIDFSYQLSLIEHKVGSPEKPLSFFGHRAFVSYWTNRILNLLLKNQDQQLSIEQIAHRTAITTIDIQYVLEQFQILRQQNNRYFLYAEPEFLKKILTVKGRPFREVQVANIHWVPHNQQ